jgi:hypothetical protein
MATALRNQEEITMDQKAKRMTKGWVLFLTVCVGLSTMAQGVPPGAAALGYTNCVINDSPTAAEIAPGNSGNYQWFSGLCLVPQISLTNYSTVSNVLALNFTTNHLDLVSTPRDLSTGALPVLAGSNGFYAEFDVWLSDNNPDHWPGVWLMPVEHDPPTHELDCYSGDPPGFERWMELDVDEGGWGPGLAGTVHSWSGIFQVPFIYNNLQNPNNIVSTALDRSQKHTFGASYDPMQQQVAWWVDGVYQMSAGSPYAPTIATQQHFYLILSTYSHGQNIPYSMYISGVRAYVPNRPGQPTNLRIISP